MQNENSTKLFARATDKLVGGVNSPVRAWKAVGGSPLFVKSANGCRIVDADDNSYCDFIGSWGPMFVGHAHPRVVAAVREAIEHGTSFLLPNEASVQLAEQIVHAPPCAERF